MIYIFSEKDDITTNEVIDWLSYYQYPFIRINDEDTEAVEQLFTRLASVSLSIQNDKKLSVLDAQLAFWFRRPSPLLMQQLANREIPQADILFPTFKKDSDMLSALQLNYKYYLYTFFDLVLNDPSKKIGSYKKTGLNKMHVLDMARKHGISVPPTLVSANMDRINAFFQDQNQDLISKSLFEVVQPQGVMEEGFLIQGLTERIQDTHDFPEAFFPTLFQQNIHKQFELRIFYLKGTCYAAAMFTQDNEQTSIDFRNYDNARPTRKVPYQLPKALAHKISLLMDELGLDNGSIDMIKGTDGAYYFLEINPVGQYGFISNPCNFNLSKLIAEELIKIYHG